MPVLRVQNLWSNFTGAPGYTNLHFSTSTPNATTAQAAATACRSFFNALVSYFPTGLSISQQAVVGVYSDAGAKTGEIGITPGTASVGTSTAAYAGGTGAVIHWKTGNYYNGRQLVGRTFLVPFAGGYAVDGTLTPTAVTALVAAAGNLKAATNPNLVVFAVKKGGGTAISAPPTAISVPDRTATMRSRR